MPIRPENKDRYPKDWKQISLAIRERAGQQCERCKAPNGEMIRRGKTSDGETVWRMASDSAYMDGVCAETGFLIPDTSEDKVGYGHAVKVVLTVAHLDHQPENCDPGNLRAWCQRCHNAYDAPMHRTNIKQHNRNSLTVSNMFA